jgi:hypothetical protein
MKNALLFRGGRKNAGRVKLSDFYQISHADHFPFMESDAHLREIGALDESGGSQPRVVIPNYLESTCFQAGSRLYMYCCISECDELLSQIEQHVGGPDTLPGKLASIVTNVRSQVKTTKSTAWLTERLEWIAEIHGGHVPIHGILFAQVLHGVFPNECPYQHAAGTKDPHLAALQTSALEDDTPAVLDAVRRHLPRILSGGAVNSTVDSASEVTEDLSWSDSEAIFVEASTPRPILPGLALIGVLLIGIGASLRWNRLIEGKGQRVYSHVWPEP